MGLTPPLCTATRLYCTVHSYKLRTRLWCNDVRARSTSSYVRTFVLVRTVVRRRTCVSMCTCTYSFTVTCSNYWSTRRKERGVAVDHPTLQLDVAATLVLTAAVSVEAGDAALREGHGRHYSKDMAKEVTSALATGGSGGGKRSNEDSFGADTVARNASPIAAVKGHTRSLLPLAAKS